MSSTLAVVRLLGANKCEWDVSWKYLKKYLTVAWIVVEYLYQLYSLFAFSFYNKPRKPLELFVSGVKNVGR